MYTVVTGIYISVDDDNRVVLHPLPEMIKYQGDYINASYIDVWSIRVVIYIC